MLVCFNSRILYHKKCRLSIPFLQKIPKKQKKTLKKGFLSDVPDPSLTKPADVMLKIK